MTRRVFDNMKTTLIIMAAGIGSRFGGGIKQLAKMGPNGEIIMDYSIYDAKEAGFDKVVFIIRKDIEKEFEINKSTVTCIIKLMEKKGYIQRQSVEYDGRLKRIRLTDKGEKSHIEALRSIKKVEGILRQNIPDEELDSFFDTINKLKSNLSKEMVNNA